MPGFLIGWSSGILLGGGVLAALCRFNEVSRRNTLWICGCLIFSVFAGTKLLFFAEAAYAGWFANTNIWNFLFSSRMRIPGGILLGLLTCCLLSSATGYRPLWLSDRLFVIAASVCLVAVRIGCWLEGCCHGTPTNLPWAVTFPPGSSAFDWQSGMSLIDDFAPHTLPVHPLQIYYAAVGLALVPILSWRLSRSQCEGQTTFWFVILYFGSTWALDYVSSVPNPVTRILCAAVVSMTIARALGARGNRATKSIEGPSEPIIPCLR